MRVLAIAAAITALMTSQAHAAPHPAPKWAIVVHGGAGVSQDTFLADAYAYARFMRIGDGPDQVHLAQLGRGLLKRYGG